MKNIIKPVTKKDINFLFLLRNNKLIRKEFFDSKKISFEEHKKWFDKKIKNKNKFYFKILKNKKSIGLIRYDKKEFYYDISVSILPKFQGHGLASIALTQSEKFLNKRVVIAKVKKDNKRSQIFFINNDYKLIINNKTCYFLKIVENDNIIKSKEIIEKIQNIRGRNNVNWMDILRIAFEKSPEKTKSIFKRIFYDDKSINKLSRKLFS